MTHSFGKRPQESELTHWVERASYTGYLPDFGNEIRPLGLVELRARRPTRNQLKSGRRYDPNGSISAQVHVGHSGHSNG
jgi:hypothetical protein